MESIATNLLIFSVQVAVVIGLGSAGAVLVALPVAVRLAYWRSVLAASLLVAVPGSIGLLSASAVTFTAAAAASLAVPDKPIVSSLALSEAIMIVWICGAITRLVWLGCGMLALVRLRRCTEVVQLENDPPEDMAGQLSNVTVCWHPAVTQPVSFGLFRPMVLLPASMQQLSAQAVDGIIRHELLHVRRRDWAWHVVEEIVCALLWFHPAIWWATDRIRLSREQIVDALVVEATGNRESYMKALLRFAETPSEFAVASPFGRHRHLVARMRALASPPNASPRSKAAAAIALGSTLTIALTVACALPWQERIYRVNDEGVTSPSVIREVRPFYSTAAMNAGIAGTVQLSAVVRPDGAASDIRVVESLDRQHGLDDQARSALRQWRFTPGTRNGVAVPVRVQVEFTFTLR